VDKSIRTVASFIMYCTLQIISLWTYITYPFTKSSRLLWRRVLISPSALFKYCKAWQKSLGYNHLNSVRTAEKKNIVSLLQGGKNSSKLTFQMNWDMCFEKRFKSEEKQKINKAVDARILWRNVQNGESETCQKYTGGQEKDYRKRVQWKYHFSISKK
jgi:hypothetical protein